MAQLDSVRPQVEQNTEHFWVQLVQVPVEVIIGGETMVAMPMEGAVEAGLERGPVGCMRCGATPAAAAPTCPGEEDAEDSDKDL